MQSSITTEFFNLAFDLLIEKYARRNASIDNFFVKFSRFRKDGSNGWYDSYLDRIPCTSNSIESTHRWMKETGALVKIQPLRQCLMSLVDLVHDWSLARNPNTIVNVEEFYTKPIMDTTDFTEAIKWTKTKHKKGKKVKINGSLCYIFPSGDKQFVTNDDCKLYLSKKDFTTFDELISHLNSVYIVRMDSNEWENSCCNCSNYKKKYKCHHIIATAIELGYFVSS